MEVYLLRHGIADNESPTGRDSDRELTDEGRRKLRELLKLVAGAGLRPEVVVSSPYVRARQTAEVAAEALGFSGELLTSESLVPESDPEDVWHELRGTHRGAESIMLVSHEPLMGRCAGYLLGTPELLVNFKKAGLMRIDLDQLGLKPRGILRWMLIPSLAGA